MTDPTTPNSSPRVSVVVPTYDAAGFVANALGSLLDQTLTDWEAIVVDDASRDRTVEVVGDFVRRDPRIRLERHTVNGGPAAARNTALAVARGTWIAVLDADDLFLPDRLETLVAYGEREGLDIVADNLWLKDPSTGKIVRSALPRDGRIREWSLHEHLVHEFPASGFVYGLLKPLVRRAFVEDAGLRYRGEFRYGEDFVFYCELLLSGARGRIVPEPGYVYQLPISEVDGNRSDDSRTAMQVSELLRSNDWVLEHHRARLSPGDAALLRKRAKYLTYRDAGQELKALRREGRYLRMLVLLVKKPFLLNFVFRGISWRLRAGWRTMRAGHGDDTVRRG